MEHSRDYIFRSGRTMEEIFQAIIDRTYKGHRTRVALEVELHTIYYIGEAQARIRVCKRERAAGSRMAEGLDSGSVIINDSTDYRLDSMPFGGVKNSGLGKEGIRFSLQEMTEPKVVCFYLPGLKG